MCTDKTNKTVAFSLYHFSYYFVYNLPFPFEFSITEDEVNYPSAYMDDALQQAAEK